MEAAILWKNNLVAWPRNSLAAAALVIAKSSKNKIIIRAKIETLLEQFQIRMEIQASGFWVKEQIFIRNHSIEW